MQLCCKVTLNPLTQATFLDGLHVIKCNGVNQFQLTPTESSNYQQTGVCQVSVYFNSASPNPGSETIILDAWNRLNQHPNPPAQVTINIIKTPSQPSEFDFDLSVSPTGGRVTEGQSATYSITVSPKIGSRRTLSASDVPQGATSTFSPHVLDPPYTTTLTIQTTYQTPPKTYDNRRRHRRRSNAHAHSNATSRKSSPVSILRSSMSLPY